MTGPDNEAPPEMTPDAALALDYAVGALERAERRAVEARLRSDPAFAALVAGWQASLAPLDAATPAVPPPPELWDRIAAETAPPAVPRPAPASASEHQGRSPELWVIADGKPPASLGLIDIDDANTHRIPAERLRGLKAGDVLAISIEPPGGSPTGAPPGRWWQRASSSGCKFGLPGPGARALPISLPARHRQPASPAARPVRSATAPPLHRRPASPARNESSPPLRRA